MALFKILHGDASRISTEVTPFHEGYCYVTHDGYMYIDMNIGTAESPNNQRIKLNAKDVEALANYYTKNEIDNLVLVTTKDIDVICGVITLISFKVGSSSYQAEEGMTFAQWVASEYNTDNYYVSGNYVYVDSFSRISSVSPNTVITADKTYSTTWEGMGGGMPISL